MSGSKTDIGKMAQGEDPNQNSSEDTHTEFSNQNGQPANIIISDTAHNRPVVYNSDIAWIEATQGLQKDLLRSLRDYKVTRSEKRALANQRERLISEVTEQYVRYLSEEAKLASEAAIKARDSILKQELAKLRAKLFTEIAEIAGVAVVEIERIAKNYTDQLTSPTLQQIYAKFIMTKIIELLEGNTQK